MSSTAQPGNIEDIYELSPLQEGMLFHSLYDPDAALYVQQLTFHIAAGLNLAAFEQAWRALIKRHAVLRTSFHWEDLSRPLQVVHREVSFAIDHDDQSDLPDQRQQDELANYLAEDRKHGFDFAKAPLMRIRLIRSSDQAYRCIWTFHHILIDGWSVQILFDDLENIYDTLCTGAEPKLQHCPPYRDYIVWLQQQDLGKAETFWRGTLENLPGPNILRVDEPGISNNVTEGEFGAHEITLTEGATSALQDLARQHRLTLNSIVQGAWAILVSRLSGERDVLFGGIVSGRPASLPGVESMVGLFINTLPVRTSVVSHHYLLPWLQQFQAMQLEAREYEFTPMLEIQRWSELPPGVPLFETIVVFENFPRKFGWDADETESAEPYFERTNYPLCLVVIPQSELRLSFYHQERRFSAKTIKRLAKLFANLLGEIGRNPDRRIGELGLLSAGDRRRQLVTWNSTSVASPELDGNVIGLLRRQVVHRPNSDAFICSGEVLTYAELDRRSSQLAHFLRARGVGPEVVVGVCLERSFLSVIALLAIWKAGGAYLPLDPALPAERLSYMALNAGAVAVITINQYIGSLPAPIAAIALDDAREEIDRAAETLPPSNPDASDLAYVLFTSGSTGRPKGVAASHRQVLNRLAWMWREYPFAPGEVCCHRTSPGFVDSLWEIVGGLLAGVPTVIVPDQQSLDASILVQELGNHGVSRLWVVPSLLSAILDTHRDLERRLPRLQFWVSTGEALSADLCDRFYKLLPSSVMYNLYGTSEVWDATWYETYQQEQPGIASRMPIGRPIDNVQAYVLDSDLEPVPVGVAGELCIAGLGLARGYVGRPDLTAERFVPHPFSQEPGSRIYRTGDRVRVGEDGTFEYLERIDEQVKIRGFRIEPGEVESALESHPIVNRAAVAVQPAENGELRLVAYVLAVNRNGEVMEQERTAILRQYLLERLPEYMVPSAFSFPEALPLTRSGKIDRRNLPPIEHSNGAASKTYAAAQGVTEKLVSEIWSEILQIDPIGRNDNVFELGAHSLLATRFVSRIRDKFKIELLLRSVFENPTVAAIAGVIASACSDHSRKASEAIVPLARERYRITIAEENAGDNSAEGELQNGI